MYDSGKNKLPFRRHRHRRAVIYSFVLRPLVHKLHRPKAYVPYSCQPHSRYPCSRGNKSYTGCPRQQDRALSRVIKKKKTLYLYTYIYIILVRLLHIVAIILQEP